jgi:hypothetical protein
MIGCLCALACLAVLCRPRRASGADVPSSDPLAGSPAGTLQLAAGYAAKEVCSCVFVEGQTDAICTPYGVTPTGVNPKVAIDHTGNTVTTTLLGTSRVAQFTSGQGCVLQGF